MTADQTLPSKATAIPLPVRAKDSHLYKYSAFTGNRKRWLYELLVENCLYVPKLDQLNDPTDGRPKLVRKSEDQLFRFLYDGPFGVIGRNPRMSVEDQIYHGVVLDVNLKKYGAEKIMTGVVKSLYKELNDWRIYSLSKRPDKLNLWAQYAANHTGYCLEFANTGSFFDCAMEVSYGTTVEMDINNRDHLNGYWFFCKGEDWSNEEEVRVLVARRSDPILKIEPTWLSRLILGWKMPDVDRAQIRGWAKQRTPELVVDSAFYDEVDQKIRVIE